MGKKIKTRNIRYGICPKCMECRQLTRHHIFPLRFFGHSNNVLHICRFCHDEIEEILPKYRKLKKTEYVRLHKQWLMEEFFETFKQEVA